MLFGRGVLRCLLKCLWGKKPSIHLTRRVPRQPLNGTKNAGDSNNLRRKMKHLELDLQKAASMLKMLRAERRVQTQCLVKAARAPACVEKWENEIWAGFPVPNNSKTAAAGSRARECRSEAEPGNPVAALLQPWTVVC